MVVMDITVTDIIHTIIGDHLIMDPIGLAITMLITEVVIMVDTDIIVALIILQITEEELLEQLILHTLQVRQEHQQ